MLCKGAQKCSYFLVVFFLLAIDSSRDWYCFILDFNPIKDGSLSFNLHWYKKFLAMIKIRFKNRLPSGNPSKICSLLKVKLVSKFLMLCWKFNQKSCVILQKINALFPQLSHKKYMNLLPWVEFCTEKN